MCSACFPVAFFHTSRLLEQRAVLLRPRFGFFAFLSFLLMPTTELTGLRRCFKDTNQTESPESVFKLGGREWRKWIHNICHDGCLLSKVILTKCRQVFFLLTLPFRDEQADVHKS